MCFVSGLVKLEQLTTSLLIYLIFDSSGRTSFTIFIMSSQRFDHVTIPAIVTWTRDNYVQVEVLPVHQGMLAQALEGCDSRHLSPTGSITQRSQVGLPESVLRYPDGSPRIHLSHKFAQQDRLILHQVRLRQDSQTEWFVEKATVTLPVRRKSDMLGVVRIGQDQYGDRSTAPVKWGKCWIYSPFLDEPCAMTFQQAFSNAEAASLRTGDLVRFEAVKQATNHQETASSHRHRFAWTTAWARIVQPEELQWYQRPYLGNLDEADALSNYTELWATLQQTETTLQAQFDEMETLSQVPIKRVEVGPHTQLTFMANQTNPQRLPPKYRLGEQIHLESRKWAANGIVVDLEYHPQPQVTIQLSVTASVDYSTRREELAHAKYNLCKVPNFSLMEAFQTLLQRLPLYLADDDISERWKTIIRVLTHWQAEYWEPGPEQDIDAMNLTVPGLPQFQPTFAQKVVGHMVLQEHRPVTLVEGPPGTGKTNLIGALAFHLLKQCPGACLLLCTPSNRAADHLAGLIQQVAQHEEDIRPMRLYTKTREALQVPHPDITLHTASLLPNLFNNNQEKLQQYQEMLQSIRQFHTNPLRNQYDTIIQNAGKLKDLGNELQKDFLAAYQPNLWITTCGSVIDNRLGDSIFTHLIIDEVGQSTQWEVLFTAFHLNKRAGQQLILVGDRHQLPPTIIIGGVAQGIAETCIAAKFEEDGTVYNERLDVCFRMHPGILHFPSQEFYEGRVISGITAAERSLLLNQFPMPNRDIPVAFIAHHGGESAPVGFSRINQHEIDLVMCLVKQLLQRNIKPKQIAALTPYHAHQVALLHRIRLEDLPLAAADVSTIDGFQGQEKDVIILSCVRSALNNNPHSSRQGIGFLTDYRRVNVALTRARHGLFLIGNPETLVNCPLWARLLAHLSRQGLVHASLLQALDSFHLHQPAETWYSAGSAHLLALGPGMRFHALEEASEQLPMDMDGDNC